MKNQMKSIKTNQKYTSETLDAKKDLLYCGEKINAQSNIKDTNGEVYTNYARNIKHYTPANKEWFNSIYAYNSNAMKILPSLNKSLFKLVKGHFNLYSKNLKSKTVKLRSRRVEIRKTRRSINNILVGRPELKHMNNKVVINICVYNAEKKYYLNKIKKIPAIFQSIKSRFFIKKTSKISLKLKSKLQDHKKSFYCLLNNRNLKVDKKTFTSGLNKYQENYMKNYIYKFLRKEVTFIYFKQLLAFNKSKFEKKFLLSLANQVKKIYDKNVEFNLVNLKYIYLNNYIYSIALITKIKKLSKIKKSFMVAVKKSLNMLNIPPVKPLDIYNEMYNKKMVIQNLDIGNIMFKGLDNNSLTGTNNIEYSNQNNLDTNLLNKFVNTKSIKRFNELQTYDVLDKSLTKFLSKNNSSLNNNEMISDTGNDSSKLVQVFKSTKYKFLNGVRVEIAGRLTKRSSAARSIFKIRNKGNIRNKDSSDKGLSTVMLRGYAKSNLQYSKLYSKVRGGSFGFKGWVSGN